MIRIRSLTVRLLLALVIPLIGSAALIGLADAWVTRRVVDYTSDRLLAGSVRAIAESVTLQDQQIHVDLPPWAFGLLDSPQRDSVFYSVRQSGKLLTGYADLPEFRPAEGVRGPAFRTLDYKGRPVRQAAEALRVPGAAEPVVISVAQTLESRTAVRKTLMTTVGLIEAGLIAVVALLVWPAATWSLRPLQGLRRRLGERSDSRDPDFAPVAVDDVPGELRPVIVAFNSLLAQLEQSVDGVRRFTADASHQMRTPLAILKTHLTLLARTRKSNADQESLADALEAVDRIQRLIEQLLALARAEAVEADGRQEADLVACIESSAKRWYVRLKNAGVVLSLSKPDDPIRVTLSRSLVEQILENLIDNALRYGGKSVVVSVTSVDDLGVLTVKDDGAGMPTKLADRPFERFARGPDIDTVGSGLGLSIVKALAVRAGGAASLSNQETGLTVTVTLPLLRG